MFFFSFNLVDIDIDISVLHVIDAFLRLTAMEWYCNTDTTDAVWYGTVCWWWYSTIVPVSEQALMYLASNNTTLALMSQNLTT